MSTASAFCQWFVGCTNTADGTVYHPILGDVPTCQRCADRLNLNLDPTDQERLF